MKKRKKERKNKRAEEREREREKIERIRRGILERYRIVQNWPRILVFPCLRDSLTPGVFPATGSRWKLKKKKKKGEKEREGEIVGRRIEQKCYATIRVGISSFLREAVP